MDEEKAIDRYIWIDPTLARGLLNRTQQIYFVFQQKAPQLSMAAKGNNAKASHTTSSRRLTSKEASLQGPLTQTRNHNTHKSGSDPSMYRIYTTITTSTGRESGTLSTQMVSIDNRSLDSKYGEGIPHRVVVVTISDVPSHHTDEFTRRHPVNTGRSPEFDFEASSHHSTPKQRPVYQSFRFFLVEKKDGSLFPVINLKICFVR